MAETVSSPTPIPTRPQRRAVAVSLAATGLSAVSGGLWIADLTSRPACPPGYVRFIDLDPAFLFLSVVLFVFSLCLVLLAVAWRHSVRRTKWVVVAAAVGAVLALGGSLLAAEMIRVDSGSFAGSCWTF